MRDKEEFKIYSNLCRNIYDASKPEVFEIETGKINIYPLYFI
jgi:hypothetical protein